MYTYDKHYLDAHALCLVVQCQNAIPSAHEIVDDCDYLDLSCDC